MDIQTTVSIEQLKQRCEVLRKKLENKNSEVTQRKKQLTDTDLKVSNYQENVEPLKAEIKADQPLFEIKMRELQDEIDKRKSDYSQVLSEQSNAILQTQRINEELTANLNVVMNDSIKHDITAESNEITLELKTKQQQLQKIHKEHNKIKDLLKKHKDDCENIYSKSKAIKTELLEQFDLLRNTEAEVFTLKATSDRVQESEEKSIFDEWNVQRAVFHEKLNLLKNRLDKLQKNLDAKEKYLVLMKFQCSQMEDVIKRHPMEYQQDLDDFLFSYKNYIKMMKNLCYRLQDFLAKKKEIINKSLPENISKYCDVLNKQQQKYEDELKEISSREYHIRKLKSGDVRDIQFEILENETNIKRVMKKITDHEKKIDDNTKDCESKRDCGKSGENEDKKCEKVLVEINSNVEHRKLKKPQRTVMFDDSAKCDNTEKAPRRGGKILQYKTVVFSNKKKCK